jgi:hypothetical protein
VRILAWPRNRHTGSLILTSRERRTLQAAVAKLGDEQLRAVSAVATFNAGRVCVPRDMGRLPAAAFVGTLNELAGAAQTQLGAR